MAGLLKHFAKRHKLCKICWEKVYKGPLTEKTGTENSREEIIMKAPLLDNWVVPEDEFAHGGVGRGVVRLVLPHLGHQLISFSKLDIDQYFP